MKLDENILKIKERKLIQRNDEEGLLIGLCDDEKYIHDIVEKLLKTYADQNGIVCQLVHYNSGYEVLEEKHVLDFLFLDIEMPELDGIETAYKLRDRGVDCKIVMLTAREDRYREAFKIGAFRFVPKPIAEKEFFRTIDEIREHMVGMTKVEVHRDGVAYSIMQRDIIYVEGNRDSTLIYTRDVEYRSEKSLANWKELLDDRMFFQCHRSYIVNMGKVEEIEKSKVLLVTGEKVEVSKRQRISFLHAFIEYDTRRR